ncbi:hypothetical protein ABIA39_008989 [Nocardia sp. GAS34]|uniref:hypothetical protein n=1 Tax=unclassified Nocardia TaxID=2637762 RepID=UPI003D203918
MTDAERDAELIARPWWSLEVNGIEAHTPYAPPGEGTYSENFRRGGLNRQQTQTMTAIHEAGHTVVALAARMNVTAAEVHNEPMAVSPSSRSRHGENGYTIVHPEGHPVFAWLCVLSAGVRAAHRWLTLEDLIDPQTAFFNDVVDGIGDHAEMRAVRSSRPLELTWGTGQPAHLPAGSDSVDVAEVYREADRLIRQHWHAVVAIADHLLEHGRADLATLRSLADIGPDCSLTALGPTTNLVLSAKHQVRAYPDSE